MGEPTPTVTWSRANGEMNFKPGVCEQKYDPAGKENTLEVSFAAAGKMYTCINIKS